MINQELEAIIFDLGGVIINIDYDATTRAFQNLGDIDFPTRYTQASQNGLFDEIETGQISAEAFVNELVRILPENIIRESIVDAWNAMIMNVPSEKVSMLMGLKKQYKIFLLSNTNSIHMERVYEEWDKVSEMKMSELFDKVYLSHEIGMRKPNGEIFEYVVSDQNLNKETTLFIDDSQQHIEGAKSVGLKAKILKTNEQFLPLIH